MIVNKLKEEDVFEEAMESCASVRKKDIVFGNTMK